MTEQNERRVLDESELDQVFGAETAQEAELRAAAATFNMLLGITTTLMNAWGQQLMGAARKA